MSVRVAESPCDAPSAEDVCAFLAGRRFTLASEKQTQGEVYEALRARWGEAVEREVRLAPPGVHAQVIGRLDREGQDANEITALYLVCDDGSDPPMMEVLGLKASQSTQIIDPHLGVTSAKTDGSHMRALIERYLVSKNAAA